VATPHAPKRLDWAFVQFVKPYRWKKGARGLAEKSKVSASRLEGERQGKGSEPRANAKLIVIFKMDRRRARPEGEEYEGDPTSAVSTLVRGGCDKAHHDGGGEGGGTALIPKQRLHRRGTNPASSRSAAKKA